MVILGLEFSTDHLSILTMGYQESFSNENVVVYDIVDLFNSFDGILVAECLKCIVSPILNFIIRNKVDRFKVRGFLLYIPSDWCHLTVGFCRSIIVM